MFTRLPVLVASLWDLPGETKHEFPAQAVICDPCGTVLTDPAAASFADLNVRARAAGWVIDGPWKVCPRCAPGWHLDEPSGVVASITARLAECTPEEAREAAHQTVLVHAEPPTADLWDCPDCGGMFSGVNGTHSPCNDAPRDDSNWTVPPAAAAPQATWPLATANVRLVPVPAVPSPAAAGPLNHASGETGDAPDFPEWLSAFGDAPDFPEDSPEDSPAQPPAPPGAEPGSPGERQDDEAYDQAAGDAE